MGKGQFDKGGLGGFHIFSFLQGRSGGEAPFVEGFDETIDLFGLLVDPLPIFGEIVPLGVELCQFLSLLLDPGEILQVVDLATVIMIELLHVGG